MTHPFQVGDRIHEVSYPPYIKTSLDDEVSPLPERDPTVPDATVTALTERGFTYRYDHSIQFVRPDWGTTNGGECYEGGFQLWRKVDGYDAPIARMRALVTCYDLSCHHNPGGAAFESSAHPELPPCQVAAWGDDEEDYQTLVAWVAKHRAILDLP